MEHLRMSGAYWCLTTLDLLGKLVSVHQDEIVSWVMQCQHESGGFADCQDKENGGISDRPDDAVDVYHTYFGVTALSLLEYPGIKPIDPAYAYLLML
ncbi:hypothetical protein MKW98_019353 [Papaver atlanticum]|uniref:Geranylgeranyl transferase type II subunit beta n=1 Tax=Papaver atlanticum TaxID=357466 RepID=A0AAD4S937_9MAGN|nr:hypothetical protein MKW98_019353 [Papaver atlanticum]